MFAASFRFAAVFVPRLVMGRVQSCECIGLKREKGFNSVLRFIDGDN